MNKIKNLKISVRLGLGFALVILISMAVALFGMSRLAQLNESLQLIDKDRVPKVQALADITEDLNQIARKLRNTLIFDDPAQQRTDVADSIKAAESIAKRLDQIAPSIRDAEGLVRLAALQAARAAFLPVQQSFIDLV